MLKKITGRKKNNTHVKKVGHISEIPLAFNDELDKQVIIKKNC